MIIIRELTMIICDSTLHVGSSPLDVIEFNTFVIEIIIIISE